MKKLWYILSLSLFLLIPLKVKASYLPPTLPQTQVIPDFLQTVAQNEIANDTYTYIPKSDLNAVNQIVNGRSIESSIQYTYLDNASLNAELGTIYNINGVEVNQNDTYTVYGTSDIGQFMCICDKGTGEILYQGEANTLHSTLLGGEGLKESFPEFIVRDLTGASGSLNMYNNVMNAVNEARLDSMIIYGNSLTASDKEFLSDYTFYFRLETNQGWSVYVPNACSSNTVVHPNHSNVYSLHGTFANNNQYYLDPIIYTNDPSEVYFSGTGNGVGLKRETNNIYGVNYTYCSSYRNAFDPLGAGFSIDMELPSASQFAQYRNASDNAYYLTPIEDIDNEPENNIYNYTYVTENPPVTNRYVNNNYNYEGDTNYNNYPIYYNFEYPTYPTTNAYTTNIYNYYNTPQEGETIGSIADPILPENIPLLSNLEKRFPFCIPFDMYKLLKGIAVQRTTPIIDISFTMPVVNQTINFYYDMAPFDSTAQLFRTLFLISYIIGLAYFSYDHFFGR